MDAGVIEKKTTFRRMPAGAEVQPEGTHFRVWAPARAKIAVVIEALGGESHPLGNEGNGWFSALVPGVHAGMTYRFRLDDDPGLYPDPVSRFQPEGPHGPSMIVDPFTFSWTDQKWTGYAPDEHILYELHVGTFTPEGTWAAAAEKLADLRQLGITTIEMMPVADFSGRFGWGYDGVNLFAPTRLYGGPDDLRAFINRAHEEGLAVILDVVYNHLGPDGNYLDKFSDDYAAKRVSEWGNGFNLDGKNCAPVRQYITSNAAYWIDEFHFDGLRLDATQQIFDSSEVNIITELAAAARQAAPQRQIYIVAENEPQDSKLIRGRDEGGYGVDALYNDDFHHSVIAAITGRREAYMSDYLGKPQELVSLAKYGFLYQGEYDRWQHQRRGKPSLDRPLRQFIVGLENHDQVSNTGRGLRAAKNASPGRHRVAAALMMLQPQIPMLFQGQEFAASADFPYFADHDGELAEAVRQGRRKFMSQFPSAASPEMQDVIPDPESIESFHMAKIDYAERDRNAHVYALYKDLIALRRADPAFRGAARIDGAVLTHEAFVLRFMNSDGDDRLLLVNLGADVLLHPMPEPLLAPPAGRNWKLLWSSEDPRYGGGGTPKFETQGGWRLLGHCAIAAKAEAT